LVPAMFRIRRSVQIAGRNWWKKKGFILQAGVRWQSKQSWFVRTGAVWSLPNFNRNAAKAGDRSDVFQGERRGSMSKEKSPFFTQTPKSSKLCCNVCGAELVPDAKSLNPKCPFSHSQDNIMSKQASVSAGLGTGR